MADDHPIKPPYEICGWDIGNDSFIISARAKGYRFAITVATEDFVESPIAYSRFQHILDKLKAGEDDHGEVWDYSYDVADAFLPQFEELPPLPHYSGQITLSELQSRGTFNGQYRVVAETPRPEKFVQQLMDSQEEESWDTDMRSSQSLFPVFTASEVIIHLDKPCKPEEIIPRQVYVHGKALFYKSCWSPDDAELEIAKHCKIVNSRYPLEELRTIRLFGIVVNSDGYASGLLYHWITTRPEPTLTEAINFGSPDSLRKKWASQLRDTAAKLHQLDVVWGDVKPDHVFIDKNDDAIVIGLEGGATNDWVDKELVDSVEGDLQGLGRLESFILSG